MAALPRDHTRIPACRPCTGDKVNGLGPRHDLCGGCTACGCVRSAQASQFRMGLPLPNSDK